MPRRGFTIVELVVVIGVLAVLLAISLPALFGARQAASELAAIAHQREAGSLVRQHGHDASDRFPFFGHPGTSDATLCISPDHPYAQGFKSPGGAPLCFDFDYWSQPMYWAMHLHFLGYDTAFVAHPPELRAQNDSEPVVLSTIDFITYGAYAPPMFWRFDDPQLERDHNVQRWSSVAHPSDKVILQRHNYVRDPEFADASGPVLSWFADGHVEPLRKAEMRPAVPLALHLTAGEPGLTTLRGLDGRDR